MAGSLAPDREPRGTGWFRDRTALVTGGSRGLGLLIARELSRAGANVAICARDSAELERAAHLIRRDTGSRPITHTCDIADPEAVDALADTLTRRWGRVDALV